MSVRVMAWVFDQAPTNDPTDQLVLLAIADRCNDDGLEAWPSIATLAKKTRLCERAVWGSIQRLKHVGVLAVRPGSGRNRSNHYQVILSSRTSCEVAPGARSHLVQVEVAPTTKSSRTSCEVDPAPRASDPSSTSLSSDTSDPQELVRAWNELTTEPIPRARELNGARRKAVIARLHDRGLRSMCDVFRRIEMSRFCRGEGSQGWVASFDWALMPRNITKILEGHYDSRPARSVKKQPPSLDGQQAQTKEMLRLIREEGLSRAEAEERAFTGAHSEPADVDAGNASLERAS